MGNMPSTDTFTIDLFKSQIITFQRGVVESVFFWGIYSILFNK